jgi:hypothetical protein
MAFGDTRPRTYIKAGALKDGDRVVFVDGGKWVEKDFSKEQDGSDKKSVYVAQVSLNGEEAKELTINATSGKSLAEKWGTEGPAWTGKTAKVSFIEQLSFGEVRKVLRLLPLSTEETWEE